MAFEASEEAESGGSEKRNQRGQGRTPEAEETTVVGRGSGGEKRKDREWGVGGGERGLGKELDQQRPMAAR
ncbi:hypothetical protein BHE74_00052938 [Ensete ventricosum]|nr:hypothetical protein BHE74_00052938 [Ensete ventricosum]